MMELLLRFEDTFHQNSTNFSLSGTTYDAQLIFVK